MDAHRISKEAGLTEGHWWKRGKDLFLTISLTESPLAPDYDRSAMTTGIVHIGVGGFHRAHEAAYLDRLMRRRAGSGPGGGAAAEQPPITRIAAAVTNIRPSGARKYPSLTPVTIASDPS